jgi:hypothetical protein
MRKIALLTAAGLVLVAPAYLNWSSPAFATCKSDAVGKDGKPLVGAALKSHMTKCERDATTACEKDAVGKDGRPLVGAAKTSHVKKCVADAVGE